MNASMPRMYQGVSNAPPARAAAPVTSPQRSPGGGSRKFAAGRKIRGWFKATGEGSYAVICAEICGLAHTMMQGTVFVEPSEKYRAWIAEKAEEVEQARKASPGGSST